MYRFWSIFFATVPAGAVGLTWYSATVPNKDGHLMWFPENISSFGGEIDGLFMLIFWITAATFLICNALMVVFMWKYADKNDGRKAVYTHGNHLLEVVWTTATALLLAFLVFSQTGIWIRVKFPKSSSDLKPIAKVIARQFEWRIIYPGADGIFGTTDDVHSTSTLCVPANERVKIILESQDVLHSFFLPNLRVKQDAVPGLSTPIWFEANKTGRYDLVCAELCGWGHYKMKGEIDIRTRGDFDSWLEKQTEEQFRDKAD